MLDKPTRSAMIAALLGALVIVAGVLGAQWAWGELRSGRAGSAGYFLGLQTVIVVAYVAHLARLQRAAKAVRAGRPSSRMVS